MKKCLMFAMLALLMFSCNEKPKILKPVSSTIKGPLNECFEVVVKDYPIIGNHVNIEFLRTNDGQFEPQIVAEFLDENGNVLATTKVDKNSNQDELRFLLANKVGESSTIAFAIGNACPTQVRFNGSTTIEENEEIPEMAMEVGNDEALIEDLSEEEDLLVNLEEESETDEEMEDEEDEDEEEDDEDDEEETPTQSVRSSSSKDWDKLLDEYESYVDQYIKLVKKASSGDMSAMTEYVSFLEKAEKLEKELDKAKNDLSVAQSQRLIKISKKMADAALGM